MTPEIQERLDTYIGDKTFSAKVQRFAQLFEASQRARLAREYPGLDIAGDRYTVKVTVGKKYTRVDIGGSGKYMVENATGDIYGIKGYGVIHRGHYYGNLDTVEQWNWDGYRATKAIPTCLCGHRKSVHMSRPPEIGPINADTRSYFHCGTVGCACGQYSEAGQS